MSPDPSNVLDEVRELTRQGRFAEALERQLWYHEHADSVPVKLSFGLGAWAELGKRYPPAREALVAARDRILAAMRDGDASFQSFKELAAMNRTLKDEAATGEAFLILHQNNPQAAKQNYKLAEKGLAAGEHYAVCASYIPDAMARFAQIQTNRRYLLSHSDVDPLDGGVALREMMENRFAEDAVRLLRILVAVGRTAEAEGVKASAIAETESETAHATIAAQAVS